MSLRSKLAGLIFAVIVISVVLVGAVSFQSVETRLITEIDRSLVQATDRFLDRPNASVRFGPRGRVIVSIPERPLGIEQYVVQVSNEEGQIIAASADVELPTFDLARWSGTDRAVIETVQSIQGQLYRVRAVVVEIGPSVVAIVQLGRDLAETNNVLDALQRRILVVGAIVAILAAIAGWLIATGMTSRLRRFSTVAEEIASTTRLDLEVPVQGSDEVGRLGRSFRDMLRALARSKDQQQQLIQDAGHELRTPLTSLRMNLDVLRRHEGLAEDMRLQVLDDLNRDVQDLTLLVEEVLTLAADPGGNQSGSVTESFDLHAVVGDVVDRIKRRSGRTINYVRITSVGAGEAIDSNRPTEVCGQRLQIERAITNLLDNAVKFDAFDSAIDVTLDGGTVTVRDRGPGIPPGEMKLIFERFHRSIASRSLPGSGLGLAIVADVARRHSGSYFARNHPEGGAEVGMTLPLANAGD